MQVTEASVGRVALLRWRTKEWWCQHLTAGGSLVPSSSKDGIKQCGQGRWGRHAVGDRAKQDHWAVVKARCVLLEEPRIGSQCGACGQLLRFGAQA